MRNKRKGQVLTCTITLGKCSDIVTLNSYWNTMMGVCDQQYSTGQARDLGYLANNTLFINNGLTLIDSVSHPLVNHNLVSEWIRVDRHDLSDHFTGIFLCW